jgi:Txe/YoeB family toxin of Txe-Axe toxin-antitoxin module
MVSLFGGGRISENKKLKEEVEKIDKDIKKLLKEAKKDPFGRGPKNEEYRKLIEKILKEIEEHKKSLNGLYGFRPNDFPELEMFERNLRQYYNILETYAKGHAAVIPHGFLEAIEGNWHKHKIKFK